MGGNGAVAPHAAATRTGHQAQRTVVNPGDTDADVVTAFHPDTESERTLLYGTNHVEIQPSSSASNLFGSSQTYTFSNDVDAIGDVYARIELTVDTTTGTDVKFLGVRAIKRCEVMVGNSTWQTLENADIMSLLTTTLDSASFERLKETSSKVGPSNDSPSVPANPDGDSQKIVCYVPLKIFTSGGPSRAHLTAGAPHQSFRIKLSFQDQSILQADTGVTAADSLSCKLFARQHIMTNFERDQIRANTIAKTLHLTQHAEKSFSLSATAGTVHTVDVELDSFSLLASHLLIGFDPIGADAATSTSVVDFLDSAELLLNTSSHSGELDGEFLTTVALTDMGLVPNYKPADSSTHSALSNLAVFPIASKAYGPDGCPLNRFDTIRLKLKYRSGGALSTATNIKVSVTCVGTASAIYSKQAASLQYHS